MSDWPPTEWIDRCAQRILHVDPDADDAMAIEVARAIALFPRTAAMEPEFAVDFVVCELQQPSPRFDRRRSAR